MGYDLEVITKTVERYIKSYSVDRDGAVVTVCEGRGVLSDPADTNQAGQQYHRSESQETFSLGLPACVEAGIDIQELMALDAQLTEMAQKVVVFCRARALVPPPEPPL